MIIYLITFYAYDTATSTLTRYRFSTGKGFIVDTTFSGFTAKEYFEPRIEQPGLIRRDIFVDGQLGGEGRASYGEITLINNDGALDALVDMQVDGRMLSILVGDDQASISTFLTYLYLPIQSIAAEYDRVSIRLRDQRALLDEPIITQRYGGTNVPPAGVDGTANLKDTPMPLFLGRVSHFAPQLVNGSRLIYQVTTGAISEVVNVYDKGLHLARGVDYSSQSDMEANAPTAGSFRVAHGIGMFRLGSSPAGQVTCAAWQYNDASLCTGASLIAQLRNLFIAQYPGIALDAVASDFTALDAVNAGQMGLMITADMTYAQAIDQIAGSLGAWWMFDQFGRLRLARLEAPAGSPVAAITDASIIDISVDQLVINGRIGVTWKITLNHDNNYALQSGGDLAGAVPAERREWLEKASRQATASDSGVQTANVGAQEITYDTLYCGAGYAQPEAARRLAMLSVPRKIYTVVTKVDSLVANDLIRSIDLGALVSLTYQRFGLSGGKLCRVVGIETDLARNQITFRLWG